MRIKFTWGTAIFLVIIAFILGIIGFFLFSSHQEYFLVEEDYYEKELRFQQQIDKMINAKQLSEKLTIRYENDRVTILFPDSFPLSSVEGTILFYRPSDARMDVSYELAPDSTGQQHIDIPNLPPGKFILKMDWKMDGKAYYQEQTLIIR